MYCAGCGAQNNDGARFCRACGRPINSTTPKQASGHTISLSPVRIILPILAIAAALAVGVIGVKFVSSIFSSPAITGSWANTSGSEVLMFNEDGSCSVPFTYDGAWLEDCDRYVIQDDGTLVLSSSRGNIRSRKYTLVKDKDLAYEKSNTYYLSKKLLIIYGREYERS